MIRERERERQSIPGLLVFGVGPVGPGKRIQGNLFLGLVQKVMVMEIVVSVILLFVGIAVLVLIHFCIVRRVFRGQYEYGRRDVIPGRSVVPGAKTLSTVELKNLPCFDYQAAKRGGTTPADCVVCLENFNDGDTCKLLPNCNHSFHARCIDSWLLKTPVCPICRTRVNPPKNGAILSEENHVSIPVGVELT